MVRRLVLPSQPPGEVDLMADEDPRAPNPEVPAERGATGSGVLPRTAAGRRCRVVQILARAVLRSVGQTVPVGAGRTEARDTDTAEQDNTISTREGEEEKVVRTPLPDGEDL